MLSRYPDYATIRIFPAYETDDSVKYESVHYWKGRRKGSVACAKIDSCADERDVRGHVVRNLYGHVFMTLSCGAKKASAVVLFPASAFARSLIPRSKSSGPDTFGRIASVTRHPKPS
jgi:hypothetical protein